MNLLRSLQKNWLAKLLSLLGAIAIWAVVMSDENPVVVVSYTVPIETQHLQDGLLVDGVPDSVQVKLRGPRNSILDINPSALKAYINLEGVKQGQESVPVKFTPPPGFVIESMSPNDVRVTIDQYVSKEVTLGAQPLGKVPDDVVIKGVTFTPERVTVAGPRHLVDQVAYALIQVNVADRKANFTAVDEVVLLNMKGQTVSGVTVTPRQGQALYEIDKVKGERKVLVVPNLVGTIPNGYILQNVEVEPKEIDVTGTDQVLANVTNIRTQDVSLNGTTSSYSREYELVFPEGVSSTMKKVMIHVRVEPQS